MSSWAGVALALRANGEDRMRSRLPTYLHPLAGRSLTWHVLRAVADLRPRPRQLLLAAGTPLDPSVTGELPTEIVTVESDGPDDAWSVLASHLNVNEDGQVLLVDAAAAALSTSLARLVAGPAGRVLRDEDGRPLAVWIEAAEAADRLARDFTLEAAAHGLAELRQVDPAELFVVQDRADLARAGAIIRDRIVRGLMERGVTFLSPETVLVDVDVTVEADTVIYPGVVLEGQTTVGSETVIGPSCRIIDSRIGSGVELKGWNYIVGTSIRNRAVLEPYVRRGHD